MPLNGSGLDGEVRGAVGGFASALPTWQEELKANFLTELEAIVGEPAWTDGDMANAMDNLAEAIGKSVVTHLDGMVTAIATKHMEHIIANAIVTTTVVNTAVGASPAETYLSGSGTGTVA
jgi:hypothetical protein